MRKAIIAAAALGIAGAMGMAPSVSVENNSTTSTQTVVDKEAREDKRVKPEKERRISPGANRKTKESNPKLNQRQYCKRLRQNPHLRRSVKCRLK